MYSKLPNKNITFTNKAGHTPTVRVYLSNSGKEEKKPHETFPQLWKVTNHSLTNKPLYHKKY